MAPWWSMCWCLQGLLRDQLSLSGHSLFTPSTRRLWTIHRFLSPVLIIHQVWLISNSDLFKATCPNPPSLMVPTLWPHMHIVSDRWRFIAETEVPGALWSTRSRSPPLCLFKSHFIGKLGILQVSDSLRQYHNHKMVAQASEQSGGGEQGTWSHVVPNTATATSRIYALTSFAPPLMHTLKHRIQIWY